MPEEGESFVGPYLGLLLLCLLDLLVVDWEDDVLSVLTLNFFDDWDPWLAMITEERRGLVTPYLKLLNLLIAG